MSVKTFSLLHHASTEDRILMTFEDNQLKCVIYTKFYTRHTKSTFIVVIRKITFV